MARAAARLSVPALLIGVSACSLPVVAQEEIEPCQAQIRASSGRDISNEKQSGWSVNVKNGRRTTVLVFSATDEHPEYICSVVDQTVTSIVEQKTIYEPPASTRT